MNVSLAETNTTLSDSLSMSFPAIKVQMILGFAVVVTNTILVFGFTKEKQFTKTTFIFLSNLATSDILFGFLSALRGIVTTTSPDQTQIVLNVVCRGTTAGSLMSAIMSSICILLLSIQVSIHIIYCRMPLS